MILEISNYIEDYKEKFLDLIFEKPNLPDGCYVLITNDDEPVINHWFHSKKNPMDRDMQKKFSQYYFFSKALSNNKTLYSKALPASSPFGFFVGDFSQVLDKQFIKKTVKNFNDFNGSEDIKDLLSVLIKWCFNKYREFFLQEPNPKDKEKIGENKFDEIVEKFNEESQLLQKIEDAFISKIIPFFLDEELQEGLKKVKSQRVFVFYDYNVEKYRDFYSRYLKERLYNKPEYNILDGDYGVNFFLATQNEKKMFLVHQTNPLQVGRISYPQAENVLVFQRLLENRRLPNPVPIFIDKRELNGTTLGIIEKSKDEATLSYTKIMRELFEHHKDDLGNYLLIYWTPTAKGLMIYDFDFVSNFKYYLSEEQKNKPIKINNLFTSEHNYERNQKVAKIVDIFGFELVIYKLFHKGKLEDTNTDEQLNEREEDKKAKKENSKTSTFQIRYFEDFDKPKFWSDTYYQTFIAYRQTFYDFIYKGRSELLRGSVFYDIIMKLIIDDIIHDKVDDNNKNNHFAIINKLNILLQLYPIFGSSNPVLNSLLNMSNNNNGGSMSATLDNFYKRLESIAFADEEQIQSDAEFAFCAGQLVYYLYAQSETADKTHRVLEPYLNKNDLTVFKQKIVQAIEKFKHNLSFNYREFNRLAAKVLAYELDNSDLLALVPIFLSGYFYKNILFEPKPKFN